jgi:energy-coupling factor transport system permease protein
MSVLFYRDVPSPLHRIEARAKLFGLAAILAAVIVHFDLLLLSLTLAALLLLTALARTFDRLWRFRSLLVILTLFSLVIWSLSRPEGRPLWGRITQEGLFLGVATALKLNAMVVAAVLLIATTRMEDLSLALQKLKVPFRLCFVLTFALSLIPGLVATADAVIQAQRARGIDVGQGNLLRRIKDYVPLLVPIFLVTVRNVNDQALALEAKGFGAARRRTSYRESHFGWREVAVCLGAAGWLGVNVLLR